MRLASSVMTSLGFFTSSNNDWILNSSHLRQFTVYGIRGPFHDSYTVTGIEKSMNINLHSNGAAPPVDSFPFLMWVERWLFLCNALFNLAHVVLH